MKKLLEVFGVLVVVVLVGGSAYIVLKDMRKAAPDAQKQAVAELKVASNACEIFSLDDAKQVIGMTAEKPEASEAPPASSDDINVSQCLYQTPITDTASIKLQKQANILARAAKSDSGKQSNQAVFDTKPDGAQEVSDYGDAAFWNAQYGQLNILKTGNWYILQVGGIAPSDRTLDEARKFADVVMPKL